MDGLIISVWTEIIDILFYLQEWTMWVLDSAVYDDWRHEVLN